MAFKPGQSGNPAGRPRGRKDEVLAAIRRVYGGEAEFWDQVATAAKGGDNECLRLLVARVRPALKSVAPTFYAKLDMSSLESSLTSLIGEVAAGKVPTDLARDLISSVKHVTELTKLEEFEQRLTELEERRGRLSAA